MTAVRVNDEVVVVGLLAGPPLELSDTPSCWCTSEPVTVPATENGFVVLTMLLAIGRQDDRFV